MSLTLAYAGFLLSHAALQSEPKSYSMARQKKRAVIYKHELILAYWSFPHPLSLVTPTQLLYEMIGLVRIPILSHAYPVASDP